MAELNGNFRTKKNTIIEIQKLSGGAKQKNGGNKGKN